MHLDSISKSSSYYKCCRAFTCSFVRNKSLLPQGTLSAASIVDDQVDFALSVPLLLEYEAVLKRPEMLSASADAIVTFNKNDFLPASRKFDMPIVLPSALAQTVRPDMNI